MEGRRTSVADADVAALIVRLQSPSDGSALLALAEVADGLSFSQGTEILRATPSMPTGQSFDDQAGTVILCVVARDPSPRRLDVLREITPSLSPHARAEAVRVAGQLGTADAYDFVVSALETYLPEGLEHDFGLLHWLQREPAHPEVVFPRLLAMRDQPAVRDEVDLVVAAYLEAGLLPEDTLLEAPEFLKPMLRRLRQARTAVERRARRAAGQNEAGWWRDARYQERRRSTEALVRGLSFVDLVQVQDALSWTSGIGDPRLVLAGLAGPISRGAPLDDSVIESLAASPETRVALFELLRTAGREDRFPVVELRRVGFAESVLVDWLIGPGELGRPPDGVEHIADAALQVADERAVCHLFRFRSSTAHGGRWLIGLVGPYMLDDPPETEPGFVYSDFVPYDDATPAEHAQRILQLMVAMGEPDE